MDLEKTPGLTQSERDTVAAYEEAHFLHAGVAMDAALDASVTEEGAEAEGLARAVARVEGAYSRLSELAPPGTPGRQGGMGYGGLLALLRGRGLGERDAVRPDEPPVPWAELPSARLLVFCCLGLMHYGFLTDGALDRAPGYSRKARLYEVPEGVRAALGEEGVAGAHGDRRELETRLWRLLERAADDGPEECRDKLQAMGYDGSYDLLVFFSRYGDDPDYV